MTEGEIELLDNGFGDVHTEIGKATDFLANMNYDLDEKLDNALAQIRNDIRMLVNYTSALNDILMELCTTMNIQKTAL